MSRTVSVVVPVYNCENYIAECIESVLAQTYPHFQLVLIDDGSTDNSGAICDEYGNKDDRITVIHQENQGVSIARNKGLHMIKGDYLTFVDADDMLLPNSLEISINTIEQHKADMVVYGWKTICDEGVTNDICFPYEFTTEVYGVVRGILTNYADYGGGYPWNKLWRVSSFDGEIPKFNPSLFYFEDLEWVIRMMLRVKSVVVCSKCLYIYRIHKNSISQIADKAEYREIGYHRSIEEIIANLGDYAELQKWFFDKYAPEIINGILHSIKYSWVGLKKYLIGRLEQYGSNILSAQGVSKKVQFRCRCLLVLHSLRLL